MTTPTNNIDMSAIMPMSFVLKPPSLTETQNQALQIVQGKRSQDSTTDVVLPPGVYQMTFDWNSTAWRSIYLAQGGSSESLIGGSGDAVSGRTIRFSVWGTQGRLTFFTTRGAATFNVHTRMGVTIVPTPLANAF